MQDTLAVSLICSHTHKPSPNVLSLQSIHNRVWKSTEQKWNLFCYYIFSVFTIRWVIVGRDKKESKGKMNKILYSGLCWPSSPSWPSWQCFMMKICLLLPDQLLQHRTWTCALCAPYTDQDVSYADGYRLVAIKMLSKKKEGRLWRSHISGKMERKVFLLGSRRQICVPYLFSTSGCSKGVQYQKTLWDPRREVQWIHRAT